MPLRSHPGVGSGYQTTMSDIGGSAGTEGHHAASGQAGTPASTFFDQC